MYGDFSRNPFSQKYRISRVFFNQGQPLIEADLNEALYSVIENQRYIKDTATGTTVDNGKVINVIIQSPIGGMEIPCETQIPSEGNATTLTVSQHPFSLAYLSKRLSDRRLVHAVEMWGLRVACRDDGGSGPPPVVIGKFKRNKPIPDDWLIRVEVHSVDGNEITFKIDTHNAGYANECKVNGKELTLLASSCFVRPIRPEEFVELQIPSPEFILPSSNNTNVVRIRTAAESRKTYTLDNAKRNDADTTFTQCRFWKWILKDVALQDEFKLEGNWESQFSVTLSGKSSDLKAGMFWLIDANELNQASPDNPICVASQYPQYVYHASLTPVQPAIPGAPATGAPAAGAPATGAPATGAPATGAPATFDLPTVPMEGNHPTPVAHLRDLPCSRLASGTSAPVIRRWLASMTLGELEGMDAEQVRSRLVRDCNLRLEDLPTLDDEIGKLVAYRDQYFGSPRSALA